jgi:glycosyltransferase involved in cell wall biosynthesis
MINIFPGADKQRRPIVYLTAIEDVARSPLIRSQVFTLLKEIATRQPGRPLALVALYPIANALRFRRELAGVRAELAAAGIAFYVCPIIFLTRYFYIPRALLAAYLPQALLWALWIGLRLRPALVHCRSYPAALVGRMVKGLAGARLLFETRALYPEEGATRRDGGQSILLDAASFHAWKQIESALIDSADVTVVVSEPSVAILAAQHPASARRIVVLPTCTRVASQQELASWRRQTRAELGLDGCLVVAYAGSWFVPEPAIELFRRLVRARPNLPWHLLLLVSSGAAGPQSRTNDDVRAAVLRALGPDTGCTALSVPHAKVARYLAGADLAAQPVGAPDDARMDERYLRVAQTALSVKFTEYLACGLPVFVSRWHGAAAALAQAHDLGVVYDQASDDDIAGWLARWQDRRDELQRRAWAFARDHFSLQTVASKYLDTYRRLIDGEERHFDNCGAE